jgi:hypothetical protein
VRKVNEALLHSVDNLFRQLVPHGAEKDKDGLSPPVVLNAPEYLFVSTNVAYAHPDLIESTIVRSFRTHLPGELARKWHELGSMRRLSLYLRSVGGPSSSTSSRGRGGGLAGWLRLSAAAGLALSLMKHFATAPALVQRMFVRSVQPFIVSSVILIYYIVVASSTSLGIAAACVASALLYFAYKYLRAAQRASRDRQAVQPLSASEGAGMEDQRRMHLLLEKDVVDLAEGDGEGEGEEGEGEGDSLWDEEEEEDGNASIEDIQLMARTEVLGPAISEEWWSDVTSARCAEGDVESSQSSASSSSS